MYWAIYFRHASGKWHLMARVMSSNEAHRICGSLIHCPSDVLTIMVPHEEEPPCPSKIVIPKPQSCITSPQQKTADPSDATGSKKTAHAASGKPST